MISDLSRCFEYPLLIFFDCNFREITYYFWFTCNNKVENLSIDTIIIKIQKEFIHQIKFHQR